MSQIKFDTTAFIKLEIAGTGGEFDCEAQAELG